jgi:hypothetical protein
LTRLSTEQKLGGRGGEAWLIPLVQGNPKWQENEQFVIANSCKERSYETNTF